MPMYGKCPYCKQLVSQLTISPVNAQVDFNPKAFNAATYLCPSCQTVLGAGLDPVSIGKDLEERIVGAVFEIGKGVSVRFDRIEDRLAKLRQNQQ
jgi:hypothetical protein